jgi:hypothetical protein
MKISGARCVGELWKGVRKSHWGREGGGRCEQSRVVARCLHARSGSDGGKEKGARSEFVSKERRDSQVLAHHLFPFFSSPHWTVKIASMHAGGGFASAVPAAGDAEPTGPLLRRGCSTRSARVAPGGLDTILLRPLQVAMLAACIPVTCGRSC